MHVSENTDARIFLSLLAVGVILFGCANIECSMSMFALPIVAYFLKFPLHVFMKFYIFCLLSFPGLATIILRMLNNERPELIDLVLIFGGILLLLNFYIIYIHLKNYSVSGGRIMAKMEGLKMYIKASEQNNLKNEPQLSGEKFTDIYPYAFAMGLQAIWAPKFLDHLKQSGISEGSRISWSVDAISKFEYNFSNASNIKNGSSARISIGEGGW